MLAPARARPQATTAPIAPPPPGDFQAALAAARLEALALLRSLLHAPLASAAETRERRLAAKAILRIPAPATPEPQSAAVAAEPAATPPAPPPPPSAQPLASPKPIAHASPAAPLVPRPSRAQIARLVSAAGADSS